MTFWATARACCLDVAGSILLGKSVGLVGEGRDSWLTAGQQESPQHVSPGLQKASEQQVEDLGMQKGATLLDFAMQQVSVIPPCQYVSLVKQCEFVRSLAYRWDQSIRSSYLWHPDHMHCSE